MQAITFALVSVWALDNADLVEGNLLLLCDIAMLAVVHCATVRIWILHAKTKIRAGTKIHTVIITIGMSRPSLDSLLFMADTASYTCCSPTAQISVTVCMDQSSLDSHQHFNNADLVENVCF